MRSSPVSGRTPSACSSNGRPGLVPSWAAPLVPPEWLLNSRRRVHLRGDRPLHLFPSSAPGDRCGLPVCPSAVRPAQHRLLGWLLPPPHPLPPPAPGIASSSLAAGSGLMTTRPPRHLLSLSGILLLVLPKFIVTNIPPTLHHPCLASRTKAMLDSIAQEESCQVPGRF